MIEQAWIAKLIDDKVFASKIFLTHRYDLEIAALRKEQQRDTFALTDRVTRLTSRIEQLENQVNLLRQGSLCPNR